MSFIISVNKLIKRNGTTSYSLNHIVFTGIDTSNPTKSPSTTETLYSLKSYPGKYKIQQVDGNLIKTGDIKLYVDPTDLTVVPTKDDEIIDGDGDTWSIVDVVKYTQQDTVILYILQIRQ